jgi:hypothetical protein
MPFNFVERGRSLRSSSLICYIGLKEKVTSSRAISITMSNGPSASNPPTSLTLPLEIRYMICEAVFAGAKIVPPTANAPRRSARLKSSKLRSLLRVCRQCHIEASPILYSSCVMNITYNVIPETIHQGLRREDVQLIKALVVDSVALKETLEGSQRARFTDLERLIIKSKCPVTMTEPRKNYARDVCESHAKRFKRLQRDSVADWSAHHGFSSRVHLEMTKWRAFHQALQYAVPLASSKCADQN